MDNKLIIYMMCGFGTLVFLSFRTTVIVQDPWKAPSWADTLKSPFPLTPSILREGEKLYNMYCVSCHGNTGFGDGTLGITFNVKPANFHNEEVKDQKDGALFWKLTEGRGNMPAYGEALSEGKRWQLVAYIRQFYSQKNGTLISSKFEDLLPLTDFTIDPKMTSQYFLLPGKVLNVVSSESQLFMVDTVVFGLTMPWSMAFLPDKSVLIAERSGKLLRVKNGKIQEKPVGGNVPKELRDIKLHPRYKKNGWIYISYFIAPVKPDGDYTVALMRARLHKDTLVEDKILYKADLLKQGVTLNGSRIAFDRDGYLYLTIGTNSGEKKTAQNLSNPLGKIMRLNDDGSIPSDNPLVHTPGALPEIYSYGHRMPQGMVRHPKTGKIWETEHGEMGGCELNIIKFGLNYGWPEVTFSRNYNGTIISKDTIREGMESPVYHWTPSLAPSGMDFAYGHRYPGWDGNLFIGSRAHKFLNRCVMKNNRVIHNEKLLQNIGTVRDVRVGPDKFLYVMTEDTGLIVRLVPVRKK